MAEYNTFDSKLLVDEQESEDDIFGAELSYSEDANFFELRSLGSLLHKLLLPATENNDVWHGHDPVFDFVQRKENFEKYMKRKQNMISKRQISGVFHDLESQITTMRNDGCLRIPSFIPHYMKFVEEDPDQSFHGRYNWYYTGGCLQHLHTEQNNLLLFVDGKSRDNLCIASLKDDPVWCVDRSCMHRVVPCSEKEIFQVIGVESAPLTLFGTRQKHKCKVYCLQDCGSSQSITECFNIESHVPYTSFDISGVHKELCTMHTGHGLSFWDIHEKEHPMTMYFPSDNPRHDKWHSLWYSSDPSVVTVAGRKSCKWIDRRTSGPSNSLKLTSLRDIQNDEEISVHFASKQNPYLIYVATNVNLFVTDIRSLESYVQRWRHQLSLPPLYSSVIPFSGENEIACIGNHYPGHVVLAFSSCSETYPLLQMPSRLDSLLSYQAHGLCLDPSIRSRMMCSLTGLTSLKTANSPNVELLTQTVASDIFSQVLFDKNTDVNSCNLCGLITKKESLISSDRWNISELHKGLSKVNLKCKNYCKRKRVKQAWQASKGELTEYKDVLSPIILEEWDVSRAGNETPDVSSNQKVNDWLNAYNFKCLSTSYEETESFWKDG